MDNKCPVNNSNNHMNEKVLNLTLCGITVPRFRSA